MSTVRIQRSRVVAPIDFAKLFTEKSAFGVKLTYEEYDFIQLSGDRVVIFDAFSPIYKYKPLKPECGAVAFPFYFGCMTDDEERVAYAGLRFNENKTVRWELLGKDEALGLLTVDPDAASVPIISGVCCFSDIAAYNEYYSHLNDEVRPLSGHIVLNGQTHTVAELYGFKYAVFSTGWGDGSYRCYAGFDCDGKVTVIIVDFGMIEYPKDDTVIELQVDDGARGMYVYDPDKTESENNIARWSHVLQYSQDRVERLNALARRGYAYHSMGNTRAALDDYLSAIECSKGVADKIERGRILSVYENAADIYCAKGDYESAIKLLTVAINADDHFNAGTYARLIELFKHVNRADKALEIAERMLLFRGDDPVAYIKHAECCVSVMDYRAAAKSYDTLASRFKLFEYSFDCAACMIEVGDFDEASVVLERHPAKENSEQYWYYKAYIDYKRHNMKSAVNNALKAREIDLDYMPALYLLIDALSYLQEYFEVARYAEEYKKLRPENEFGYSVCAEAHLILGNFSESAKNYCYLYDKIKSDDRYAAIGALVCSSCGDNKHVKRFLKNLKGKHSPYGYGVLFGLYTNSYRLHVRHISIERIADKFIADDDFTLLLSIYLLQTDNARSASMVLDAYNKASDISFESLAQKLRICDRKGDKKSFISLLDQYVQTFLEGDFTADDKRELAVRLMNTEHDHVSWLDEIV